MRSRIKYVSGTAIVVLLFCFYGSLQAATKTSWSIINQDTADTDGDKLSNWKEANLYNTDPKTFNDISRLPKHIYISLKYQELRYYSGDYLIDDFLVSTGVPGMDTPTGEFAVLKKVPTVLYQGPDYYLPNTKWNLMFKTGYYVHGAYWHSNFGNKMSHGCVNVSYIDVKPLYDWAEIGTPITILAGDFPSNLEINFPKNTLVQDGETIYLISKGKKYGFTNMSVFTGLGYSMKNVEKRSTSGIEEGYALNNVNMYHETGSWLISGQTVYYATEAGLIPIPTWEILLSNSGHLKYFVEANVHDLNRPILSLMTTSDPRVDR